MFLLIEIGYQTDAFSFVNNIDSFFIEKVGGKIKLFGTA